MPEGRQWPGRFFQVPCHRPEFRRTLIFEGSSSNGSRKLQMVLIACGTCYVGGTSSNRFTEPKLTPDFSLNFFCESFLRFRIWRIRPAIIYSISVGVFWFSPKQLFLQEIDKILSICVNRYRIAETVENERKTSFCHFVCFHR